MLDRPIGNIEKSDIEDLVSSGRVEDRRIEYKRDLPGGADADKKEFLADVSAFANAQGGDILYGIIEDRGVPTAATGVKCDDFDGIKLRLQNILESNLNPRLPSYSIARVDGFVDGPVVIIRVESSWRAPHMVTANGTRRFYVRRDGQKAEMDVTDLRTAFVGSEAVAERVRAFRDDRVTRILGGRSPMALAPLPTTVLHILPVGAAFLNADLDPRRCTDVWRKLNVDGDHLEFVYSPNARPNLDGLLVTSPNYEERFSSSPTYTQVFRNGGVEFTAGHVDYRDMTNSLKPVPYLHGEGIEMFVIDMCRNVREFREAMGLGGPVILMLSLVRVAQLPLAKGDPARAMLIGKRRFDRDVVLLPELVLESFEHLPEQVRPVLDAMWQSAGYMQSDSYDSAGKYVRPRER